tara:strand:+ start:16 stop:189 length:174 start_codon:yes stop_codon:yes gene_type:complete
MPPDESIEAYIVSKAIRERYVSGALDSKTTDRSSYSHLLQEKIKNKRSSFLIFRIFN